MRNQILALQMQANSIAEHARSFLTSHELLSKNIANESNQAANDAYQQVRDQMHSIIQSLQSIMQDLHSSMSKQVSMA
jgi:ABC-type transporter Mla subunit MlaD